jgi:hypothetical protein
MSQLYACCGDRCGDRCNTIDIRSKMIAHVFKNHVPLQSSPYYCSLCLFRSLRRHDLDRHVTGFRPHLQRKEAMLNVGIKIKDEDYLKESTAPHQCVEGVDFVRTEQTHENPIPTPVVSPSLLGKRKYRNMEEEECLALTPKVLAPTPKVLAPTPKVLAPTPTVLAPTPETSTPASPPLQQDSMREMTQNMREMTKQLANTTNILDVMAQLIRTQNSTMGSMQATINKQQKKIDLMNQPLSAMAVALIKMDATTQLQSRKLDKLLSESES